jgi:ParB family transcriptional regulator, chromosome partitioning protein
MVDPSRCCMWHLHDRLEEYISAETCKAEIESFQKYGQLIPTLGRRLHDDPDYDIELICGARRLFVARHTKMMLRVELCEMSDKEALVAMDMENRQRMDISAYERGLSYARWLRAGYFESQDEMARALNVSPSRVSRLLKLTRLPTVVLDAFGSSVHICEGWGYSLAEALEDPLKRRNILAKARVIAASPRQPAREVYRLLIASSTPGRKAKSMAHDEVVKGEDGKPLFRIKQQRGALILVLPVERIPVQRLDSIKRFITHTMGAPLPGRVPAGKHFECDKHLEAPLGVSLEAVD